MALADLQRALARAYTDPAFRARIRADASGAAAEMNLSDQEAKELIATAGAQIDRFARSLKIKRLSGVRDLLPLTDQILGRKPFADLFLIFAETSVPSGTKKHLEDAERFAEWLLRRAEAGSLSTAARDSARYDAGRLRASTGRRLVVMLLRHAPSDLRAMAYPPDPEAPRRRSTLAVWLRGSASSAVRHFCIPLGRRPAKGSQGQVCGHPSANPSP